MATQRMRNAQVRIAAKDVICANVRYFLAFVVANSQRAKAFTTESTETVLSPYPEPKASSKSQWEMRKRLNKGQVRQWQSNQQNNK